MFKLSNVSIVCILLGSFVMQGCGEPSRFESACVNFAPWSTQMSGEQQQKLCSCLDDSKSELSEDYQEKIINLWERNAYELSVHGDEENNQKFFGIYARCHRSGL